MPWDVKAVPEATTLAALPLAEVLLEQHIKCWWFVAAASEILYVQEETSADIPDHGAHQQGADTPQHLQDISAETVVGDGNEG